MMEHTRERNRLSSKRTRERKKDYVEGLEETCKVLKNQNHQLTRELERVKKELRDLKKMTGK